MSFKISARTILHLGAELISSDGIALYELIKNAYDADSPNVTIDIYVRIPYRTQKELQQKLLTDPDLSELDRIQNVEACKDQAQKHLDATVPGANLWIDQINACKDAAGLLEVVERMNEIKISDTGTGMSLADLDDAFLTVGTPHKLTEPRITVSKGRQVLGEKGIGRLSAMRLGNSMRVVTSKGGEGSWNVLEIDWDAFTRDLDAALADIPVSPTPGPKKEDATLSGTTITITSLAHSWRQEQATDIARQEFAKLNDPFEPQNRFPIRFRFNQGLVLIPDLPRTLLDYAHARVSGSFSKSESLGYVLTGEMTYKGRVKTFSLAREDLLSLSDVLDYSLLEEVGPFSFEFYWYNRRILTAIDGLGMLKQVRETLADWAGGLMLYRDGFRVMPYGGPDDDWLSLDRRALARGGYKLNRTQLVGRAKITSEGNPALVDQANREGLRDCDEKKAFVSMLRYVVSEALWLFLNQTDKEEVRAREPVDLSDIDARLEQQEQDIVRNLDDLIRSVPEVKKHREVLDAIRHGLESVREIMSGVRRLTEEYEQGRSELVNLAGVGLTVEILAHEINRATEHALQTLSNVPTSQLSAAAGRTVETLASQLKTLQKRLRILDPLSTAGRNRKEQFDAVELVRDVLTSHSEHFQRERIEVSLRVHPDGARLHLRAVKGMIVQILENLISNSSYWLRQRRRLNPDHRSEIVVEIDASTREIRFTDNGPGIAVTDQGDVFQAFFTTKPAGQGKGLGLFISREIAKYHGAELNLDHDSLEDGRINTFVLGLGSTS